MPSPSLSATSVIVATKDRASQLAELVQSISRCDPTPGELIIVDDGSLVPVPQKLLLGVPFRCQVIRNERSVGPGAARNRGVHASRGDHLLFTDDDCTVHPAWVGNLVSHLESGTNRRVGGVGGTVRARGRDVFSRYYDFHRILEPRPHDRAYPDRIPYLVTANCAVTRDAFMSAGGFDGRIPVAGGEDAALSLRIVRRGFHLEKARNALVWHAFRPGIVDFARTFYRYGLGGRYVVDRYLPL